MIGRPNLFCSVCNGYYFHGSPSTCLGGRLGIKSEGSSWLQVSFELCGQNCFPITKLREDPFLCLNLASPALVPYRGVRNRGVTCVIHFATQFFLSDCAI